MNYLKQMYYKTKMKLHSKIVLLTTNELVAENVLYIQNENH